MDVLKVLILTMPYWRTWIRKNALVIVEDIGWSDIGAWEALKEALEQYPYENIIRGGRILNTSATPLFITMTKKTHCRHRP